MQMVIVIPCEENLQRYGGATEALLRPVCGVPLLVRTVATALRAGADRALIIHLSAIPPEVKKRLFASVTLKGLQELRFMRIPRFDPAHAECWREVAAFVGEEFLWLPWNWMTNKHGLAGLGCFEAQPKSWASPMRLTRAGVMLGEPLDFSPSAGPEGTLVTDLESIEAAERWLVDHSGKPLDGIYSKFNRRLCRPVVRMLTHTFVSPNMVTLAGLLAAIASAYCFSMGPYVASVIGALLFFLSGLADEADGMLARIRFSDSAFGTWFEGAVDNVTYLLLFGGITLGLYKKNGPQELLIGEVMLVGCALAVGLISWQRKRATTTDRPNEYLGNVYKLMDADRTNWISRISRQINVFLKKASTIHYVLLFTVLGMLPLLLRLAAFASNLTWILTLYFSHRFFRRPASCTGVVQLTLVPRR